MCCSHETKKEFTREEEEILREGDGISEIRKEKWDFHGKQRSSGEGTSRVRKSLGGTNEHHIKWRREMKMKPIVLYANLKNNFKMVQKMF